MDKMNKKASNWFDYWAEYMAFILLILGFVLAVLARSATVLYITALLFGGIAGRWWWKFKGNPRVVPAVIIFGFLVGYLLGSFYGSRKVVLVLFAVGMGITYILHDRGIIHSAEY